MIGGSSPGRGWEFFSSPPCPDLHWGLPSLLSIGYEGALSLEVKRPRPETDHVEVKCAWSCTSTRQYASMTRCLVKNKSTGTTLFNLVVNCIHLAQDRDMWQALVNTGRNLWVP
jgi:hypothetical protein